MQGIGSFVPIVWLLELDLPSGKRVLTILFYKICSQLSLKLDVSPTTLDEIALEGLTSVVRFVDSDVLSERFIMEHQWCSGRLVGAHSMKLQALNNLMQIKFV